MLLQENPFYLLNVTCRDDRRKIAAAVDEMSFDLDTEVCAEAQNSLLNMAKRTDCELNWFPAETKDSLSEIREQITQKKAIRIQSGNLLTQLNAVRWNYSLLGTADTDALYEHILAINEQFALLDDTEITDLLNECRRAAKMPETSAEDVSGEINTMRQEIRQEIASKFAGIEDEVYRELITNLSEKFSGPDDIILSDQTDEYEIRMQSVLEDLTNQIKTQIEKIKSIPRQTNRYTESMNLIGLVKTWDQWAQPLQIKSQLNGIPHRMSEDLGNELRMFCAFLYNEKQEVMTSFLLTSQLKDIFAESPELSRKFHDDLDLLAKTLRSGNFKEDSDSFFKKLSRASKDLLFTADKKNLESFFKVVHDQLEFIQTIELPEGTIDIFSEAIFRIARKTSLKLFNKNDDFNTSKNIIEWLQKEFHEFPDLVKRTQKDLERLQEIQVESEKPKESFFKRLLISPYD